MALGIACPNFQMDWQNHRVLQRFSKTFLKESVRWQLGDQVRNQGLWVPTTVTLIVTVPIHLPCKNLREEPVQLLKLKLLISSKLSYFTIEV